MKGRYEEVRENVYVSRPFTVAELDDIIRNFEKEIENMSKERILGIWVAILASLFSFLFGMMCR